MYCTWLWCLKLWKTWTREHVILPLLLFRDCRWWALMAALNTTVSSLISGADLVGGKSRLASSNINASRFTTYQVYLTSQSTFQCLSLTQAPLLTYHLLVISGNHSSCWQFSLLWLQVMLCRLLSHPNSVYFTCFVATQWNINITIHSNILNRNFI